MRTTQAWLAAVLTLLGVGIGAGIYLTNLHLSLVAGGGAEALCDLGGNFSCSQVNASDQAELFGIPQSVIGIAAYLVMGGLAVAARKSRPALAALFGAGVLTVLYSGWLAYQSAFVIKAWCVLCMTMYAVNLGVTGLSAWAGGASLFGEAVATPARAPRVLGSAVGAFLLLLGVGFGGYSSVRGDMAAEAAKKAVEAPVAAAKPASTAGAAADDPTTKKVKVGAKRADVPVPADAASIGPKNAKVTIVELSDFMCPFCKRLAGTLPQLLEEYPKDVRVVFVNFPLNLDCNQAPLKKTMHPDACHMAAAGWCAQEQGHFWEMHDALFEGQGSMTEKKVAATAQEIGLDVAKFKACLADPGTLDAVKAQTKLGADLDVTGTPTFFVNGRQMAGGQPIEVLRAVVDAELAGNQAALDLDVALGAETTGPVEGAATVNVTTLDHPFAVDAFEASGKAESKPNVAPTRGLSWYEARDACAAAGKRLCTEEEWLAACTGTKPVDADGNGLYSDDTILGRKYGYGDDRRSGFCADSRNPEAVGELLTGNHPKCGTPDGIYDMVGGVKEWVGLTPGTAGVKGGSYSSGESARCGYFRDDIAPATQDASTGFRCCSGPVETPEARPGRDVGEKLAKFSVPLLDGKTFDTKSLAGKPTIITFWASWCGPCKKELPALAKLYETYKAQGLEILAISVDTDEKKLTDYLASNPLPFRVARDPGGTLMGEFTERGVPASFWIQRDGTVRLRTIGVPPNGEKRLEELVKELVGSQP